MRAAAGKRGDLERRRASRRRWLGRKHARAGRDGYVHAHAHGWVQWESGGERHHRNRAPVDAKRVQKSTVTMDVGVGVFSQATLG